MNDADRIVREHLRQERLDREAAELREQAESTARARDLSSALQSLVPEVLVLLAERDYPDVEPVHVTVNRFPPLGNLFGTRSFTKGGWEIASWRWGPEKPLHHVWLLANGRFVWNGRMATSSDLSEYHVAMVAGLTDLRDQLT